MAHHNELGKAGEESAVRYLQERGYTILHRDWKAGKRDLDIVATNAEGTLVIAEVKTRRNTAYGTPDTAITTQKIRHILEATEQYLQTFDTNAPIRFDVLCVVGTKEPFQITHIEDAFISPIW